MDVAFGDTVRSLVRRIPPGRVLTYGAVAESVGRSGAARAVGSVMRALPEGHDVPWWRVVGAGGRISIPDVHGEKRLQRVLLEAEGVGFDGRGRVPLAKYLWQGP